MDNNFSNKYPNKYPNKSSHIEDMLGKDAVSQGSADIEIYGKYYDVSRTIAVGVLDDPGDAESNIYQDERVYEALQRRAKRLIVTNDGTYNLFVRESHNVNTFSPENVIHPGDVKIFHNVYELRLRSPLTGLPYRVSEHDIFINCCPISVVQSLSPDYFTSVALGNIPGASSGSRVGSNDNIPSTTFILLSNVTSSTSPINFPAAAQQMQVVSSSASDTAAGTGAQQVEITYLTTPAAGFERKTEIVTMAGLATVNTIATDIYRIERFRVSRVGTSLFALGNISLQNTLGTIIFERIDALTNVNRTAIHWVPKGYQCIVTDITIGCSTAGGVIFILEETELDPSNNPVTLGQSQLEISNQGVHINLSTPHVINNSAGKQMFFALVVKGRASNQQASGSFSFIDILI